MSSQINLGIFAITTLVLMIGASLFGAVTNVQAQETAPTARSYATNSANDYQSNSFESGSDNSVGDVSQTNIGSVSQTANSEVGCCPEGTNIDSFAGNSAFQTQENFAGFGSDNSVGDLTQLNNANLGQSATSEVGCCPEGGNVNSEAFNYEEIRQNNIGSLNDPDGSIGDVNQINEKFVSQFSSSIIGSSDEE